MDTRIMYNGDIHIQRQQKHITAPSTKDSLNYEVVRNDSAGYIWMAKTSGYLGLWKGLYTKKVLDYNAILAIWISLGCKEYINYAKLYAMWREC